MKRYTDEVISAEFDEVRRAAIESAATILALLALLEDKGIIGEAELNRFRVVALQELDQAAASR